MTEDVQSGHPQVGQPENGRPIAGYRAAAHAARRGRRRLWVALAVAVLLIAVLVGPRMVSLNRYKNRITGLIATSLGRPVELSSVEMRLLPWPAFELSDLSVAEDPAYGTEPVLHASTVTASIRFLPLWRGKLEIGTISVDDASLNLVHSGPGKWNLDPLFRTAAAKAGSAENSADARRAVPLPYLEATNSRINIKDGAEKLPFSLVNTDFEFWQESPGEWHIRLRGQPARTDVSLYQEDTGVLRLEANVGRAPALREMPIHLDLDWRQAQLGQLARLITGSDPGWRGDLTGEMHVDGTANAAQVRTRLQAAGVHRAEFAPPEPVDFDANCAFVYHYSRRVLENLVCDSPLGDGHVRVTGGMPRADQPPQLAFELDRVPVAAGLDALRTLRSDVPEDLEASGAVSGKISFAPAEEPAQPPASQGHAGKTAAAENDAESGPMTGELTGALTVDDFSLSGAGLNRPIQISRLVLAPAGAAADAKQQNVSGEAALEGTVTMPAGGATPLALGFRVARAGYAVTLRGQANLDRARELFHTAGVAGLDAIAGEPLALDLRAEGPWVQTETTETDGNGLAGAGATGIATTGNGAAGNEPSGIGDTAPSGALVDSLSGTVIVHDVNWKAEFLAHDVQITQATLHLGNGTFRWDPVEFAYGPVKGTATLIVPVSCAAPPSCPPQFAMHFGSLDAATLETAILGVRQKGTLLSDLIERLHPESSPPWPQLQGSVSADSLVLGPVTFKQPQAQLRIEETGAEITHLEAGLLGGKLEGSGEFDRAATEEDKPAYALDWRLDGAQPQAVGRLIGEGWSGGALKANGQVKLAGYTAGDLSSSATGKLHLEWRRGAVAAKNDATPDQTAMAAALRHFDLWIADAAIKNGAITLGSNQVQAEGRGQAVQGSVTFGDPPTVSFPGGDVAHARGAGHPRASGGPAAAGGQNADVPQDEPGDTHPDAPHQDQ
jgi:hypothetical protein